jgi:hypothetical protein
VLAGQRRHPVDQLLMKMMKESDNFYAECLLYQTAASTGYRPARASDAHALTRRLINRLGLNGGDYRLADGSGLSLYNYVSAELMVRLLRHAWRRQDIWMHLLPSLPIAGQDGTLAKRMTRSAAEGNVRAKTGTLTGIASLAGYCTAAKIDVGLLRLCDHLCGTGQLVALCQLDGLFFNNGTRLIRTCCDLNILRDIDKYRAGSAGFCDHKCFPDRVCELVYALYQEIVLCNGQCNTCDIDFLKTVLAEQRGGDIARDRQHGN